MLERTAWPILLSIATFRNNDSVENEKRKKQRTNEDIYLDYSLTIVEVGEDAKSKSVST